MRKMLAVARKEFRQIRRDRRTLLILLFVPAFFLLLYGYALNFDIRNIALAVEDRDGTTESRALVSAFVNSGYFTFVGSARSAAEIEGLLERNQAQAALVIPEGLGRAVRAGEAATVQVLVNGENANTANVVVGYATSIVRSVPPQRVVAAALPPLIVEPRIWYNPELRSTLFLVPGLIAYLAMLSAVVSTALSIVREKETGTMEQIRMAPIGAGAFILGKSIPYFIIALASAVLIVLASMALFDMPMRGSWWSLLVALSLFLVGALGTGLLVSTVSDSQQVAFQLALIVAFLPTLILSGFIFPISSMPEVIRAVTYVVPARYFLVALRGIVLKGSDLAPLVWQLGALLAYALGVLALASVRLAREHS